MKKIPCLAAIALLALPWVSNAQTNAPAPDGMQMARAKNCVACHAVDRKLIGPSFKDVAARYANDKQAAQRLAEKVRAGGVGVWGRVPMPANPQVDEQEAAQLVNWVLSTR